MSPDPSSRAPDRGVGRIASGGCRPGGTAGVPAKVWRKARRFTAATTWRLGSVEYALLALIALGVTITVVMAIVNP